MASLQQAQSVARRGGSLGKKSGSREYSTIAGASKMSMEESGEADPPVSSIKKQGSKELAGETGAGTSGASASAASHAAPGNDLEGMWHILKSQPFLTFLIIFIPLGWASRMCNWGAGYVFALNFVGVVPLAWLIGKSTEDASASLGPTVGGLMNATFGNVVEMLLCVAGIRNNEIVVVQCTLLGSMLSNLLLVLGSSFLIGGYYFPIQRFSQQGAATQCSLMAMAVFAIGLPTLYANILTEKKEWGHMVAVSRWSSIFLLLVYIAYLYFQLVTHKALFEDEDEEGDEEPPDLSPCGAAALLLATTIITAITTEFLVGAIEGTVLSWGVSEAFIGIILLPIIGNAAEHWTALTVAARDKMDLALGVAAGSSCQMALLVTPFTVIAGWVLGRDMTLDFHAFQLAVLVLSVFLATTILSTGQSNWLEGLMLLVTYVILAMIYFFEGTESKMGLATRD